MLISTKYYGGKADHVKGGQEGGKDYLQLHMGWAE